ncbi:hypothetical protein H072_6310 [Dactylellina haptotyla CBS 200.50]|uniref:G domain-containing protein n=1 Tax=Dactylellina haptotyla (strain CBS 200.50) TaxID=1284197 RepID=S8AAM2_DACHA|nr:hypothetical protein H072_6310 [Dactylellina haptotyla CBS 200.50]
MERNPWREPKGVLSGDDADGESVYSVLTPPEILSDIEESNADETDLNHLEVKADLDNGIQSIPVCADCNKWHYRRRLILCADGENYDFSDPKEHASEGLQPSSIYRISKVVETSLAFDGLSEIMVEQIVMYKGGVIASSAHTQSKEETDYNDMDAHINWSQEEQIATENRLKDTVRDIYTSICKTLVCAGDELFLFGEGMGATALVATARLLHLVGRLKLETYEISDLHFQRVFDRAWDFCKTVSNTDQEIVFEEKLFCPGPKIHFMGLIETNNLSHADLKDLSVTIFDNVAHAYQALGLNQNFGEVGRLQQSSESSEGAVTEAWFFGNQLDLNGTRPKNGLSLWPLQWLVAEGRGKGLVLNSTSFESSEGWEDMNTLELFLPQEGHEYPFWFSNGTSVNIWDITAVFKVENHQPEFQTSWTRYLGTEMFRSPRQVFEEDGALQDYGIDKRKKTIIHPSVFYHGDQFSRDSNWSSYRQEIEDFRQIEVDLNRSRFFWTSKKVLSYKLRILVCGNEGVGKSSLINSVFNTDEATVTLEQQTKHNIEEEVVVHKVDGEDRIIIHDSNGFETGDIGKNQEAEDFVEGRCYKADPNDQLHCIWYCIKSDNPRKGDASVQRILSKCFKEWRIPLVIVFTQSLRHEGVIEADIKARYKVKHGRKARISEDELEREIQKEISAIRSLQNKWIHEVYKETLGETTLSDEEAEELGMSAFRIQRTDKNDHQSLQELVAQTYDLIDPNLWNLFIKAQRVSYELKSEEAIRHGVRVIEGKSLCRTLIRHFTRVKELKDMAKAILRMFAWDMPAEEIWKIVEQPGDKILEDRFFLAAGGGTLFATGATAGIIIAEEVALGVMLGAAGAAVTGVAGAGVSYWLLKRHQIRGWTRFLCCFTVISYRATVRALQRPSGGEGRNLTAQDFLDEKLSEHEFKDLGKELDDLITMKSCFVVDYSDLEKKVIALTRKYTIEREAQLASDPKLA